MGSSPLNLPIDIPWRLIAVSPDMMDTQFCTRDFPFQWRSSLAISGFEPRLEDLPSELCDQRITYLKIAATITGYQPTADETTALQTAGGYLPIELPGGAEAIDQIISEYWACYGALLNVAVFPDTETSIASTVSFPPPQHPPGAENVANPYQNGEVTFAAKGVENNVITSHREWTPTGWGGVDPTRGDLVLPGWQSGFHSMRVTLPTPCSRVEANIVVAVGQGEADVNADLFTITAFDANGQVEQSPVRGEGPHAVVLESEDIVALELTDGGAPVDAVLVGITYSRPIALADYPHILDFEPKTRDLYQSATETGEVLTASNSELQTGKSYTHSHSSEMGLALGSKNKAGSNGVGSESSSALTAKWGDTSQDSQSVAIDSSRDRRERFATSTELTQLYNLLTGYHVGTNRALFLMLPRPHTLQPTDHRTFVQGLRFIEGVQEFLLIVARPRGLAGLCVEAFLETGHFPENVQVVTTPPPTMTIDFRVRVHADNGLFSGDTKDIGSDPQSTFQAPAGWFIDYTKGDLPDHPGVSQIDASIGNSQAQNTLRGYNYRAVDDTHVQVSGQISGSNGLGAGAIFDCSYRVFLTMPPPTSDTPKVTSHFLVTNRSLCACLQSGKDCIQLPPSTQGDMNGLSIVFERSMQLSAVSSGGGKTWLPAIKTVMRHIDFTMSTSWRLPSRLPRGEVGFLDSDYLKNRIQQLLPENVLARPIGQIAGLAEQVVTSLGAETSVGAALSLDLATFSKKTGLSLQDSGAARRLLLGLEPPAAGSVRSLTSA